MKKWIRALVAGVVILAVILFRIFVLRNTQKTQNRNRIQKNRIRVYRKKQYIE